MEDGPSPYLPEQHYQMGVNIAGEATLQSMSLPYEVEFEKKKAAPIHMNTCQGIPVSCIFKISSSTYKRRYYS